MDIVLSLLATFLIILIVPIVIYGFFTKYAGLKEPDKKLSFMVSVMVQKLGTTFGLVALFAINREYFTERWVLYSLIWIGMFAIVEVGQALGPGYSKKEAVAGIISEAIYFPLAALVVALLLS